ncbi:MAG: U32 family peptidase, partial [Ignavibacteriaceae bacterium]|nr:U32 family peptidase [Ignavibacteriaceae bacterium]
YLYDLIESGITSFKIEGRLKDISYIKNITAFYRRRLDEIIEQNPRLKRTSVGSSKIPFTPDPERTFNRGYTTYFVDEKDKQLTSPDTPKSKGKLLGEVTCCGKDSFIIKTNEKIINGDGICFIDGNGELSGMYVNKIEGNKIYTTNDIRLKVGTNIFRNHDHQFFTELNKHECHRKIKAKIFIEDISGGIQIKAVDESGVSVVKKIIFEKTKAANPKKAIETIKKQFSKSGNTIFDIEQVELNFIDIPFLSVKECNEYRREILTHLEEERIKNHPKEIFKFKNEAVTYPQQNLDYRANVVNRLAKEFYTEHGVDEIDDGFEISHNNGGKTVMICKFCIKDELNSCPFKGADKNKSPLFLVGGSRKYLLHFNCKECLMEVKIVDE